MGKIGNVIGLAKGTGKRGRPPKLKSGVKPKSITDMINDDDMDKDAKAKKTVENLLKDSTIENVLKDEVTPSVKDVKSVEWLEEQVELLSKENESLKKELNNGGDNLKRNLTDIFLELQAYMLKFNKPQQPYSKVKIDYLLNLMLKKFDFLKQVKRF
jgi:hypothetical protein